MFSVETEIVINASPQVVWDILVDFEQYHEWSTMLHYEAGTPALGNTLTLNLTPPEGASYSFSPKITEFNQPHLFAWIGITGIKGIFDGEHIFQLEQIANDQTKLTNREVYSGILSPIIKRLGVLNGAKAGFLQMNQEIKTRVETLQEHSA